MEGEDQNSLAGQDDKAVGSREPLEYAVLDHLNGVPHEFMNKVKHNMEMHENLVLRLRRRNEKLQGLVAARAASAAARTTSPGPGAEAPAGTTTGVAGGRARQSSVPGMSPYQALRRTSQASQSRLSLEMPEAAARARLEHACGVARECLAATSRRARREVEDSKLRASVARLEREQIKAELAAKKRDKAAFTARAVSLGAAIRAAHARGQEAEIRRAARDRELEELRAEIRAYRSAAAKMQALQL